MIMSPVRLNQAVLCHAIFGSLESVLEGEASQLHPGGHRQLDESVRDMRFDGAMRDVKLPSDLTVAHASSHQANHSNFRTAELVLS